VKVAVIDSSPLINLAHLGLAVELVRYFDKVYVPRAVQREVNRKGRFRYRLNRLYQTGIFAKCAAGDEWNIRKLRGDVGEGEAEALIQAQEKGAAFFLGDDARAREIAESMGAGLKPVGTLRLLASLNLQGRAPELRSLVRILQRDLGFRVSDRIVKRALEIASEPF